MSSFTETLQSGGIRLLAGNKDFLVHRALLARHLPHLRFSSRDRCIELDTEDEESVGYLLEFIYTGDYSVPGQQQDHPPQYEDAPEYNGDAKPKTASEQAKGEEIHPIILASRTSGLGVWGRPKAVHTNFSQTPVLPFEEAAFLRESSPEQTPSSDYPHPASLSTKSTFTVSATSVAPSSLPSPLPSQTDVATTFLTHARIYLLAERYVYSALQSFSLAKLRAALKAAEIEGNQLANTVKLIREIYGLELEGENNGATVQRLRDIVVAHVVGRLADLQANEEFGAYVREGGGFLGDLLSELVRGRMVLK